MDYVLKDKVFPEFAAWAEELAAIRHEVHSTPELGFDTPRTVARIARNLSAWGVDEVDTDIVKGGVIATVAGSRAGRTVAFRADIDALGMNDCSGKPWQSTIAGHAHACGHDGHQTWAMGVARYFAGHRDFAGRIVFIFQPAEEIGKGANAVIAAGVFEKYGIAEIYGAHDEPFLPKGVFGFREGPLQAASDSFWITLHGKGTHGGRPHMGIDTVPVAAQIILALQTIISRKRNPVDAAVLSVCSVNAGRFETPNVIPNALTMSGTVRTYSLGMRAMARERLEKMTQGIAQANDCTADIRYECNTSAVNNDPALTANARSVAAGLFGADHVSAIDPMLSSEDFAEYQRVVPGVMMRIGIRDESHTVSVHNEAFDFNDEVLPAACTMLASVLRSRLQ